MPAEHAHGASVDDGAMTSGGGRGGNGSGDASGPQGDNWGILQFGLTLKDPVARQGGQAVDPAAAATVGT